MSWHHPDHQADYRQAVSLHGMDRRTIDTWLSAVRGNLSINNLKVLNANLNRAIKVMRQSIERSWDGGISHRMAREERARLHGMLSVLVPVQRATHAAQQQRVMGQPLSEPDRIGAWLLSMASGLHPRHIEGPVVPLHDRKTAQKIRHFPSRTFSQFRTAKLLVEQFPQIFPPLPNPVQTKDQQKKVHDSTLRKIEQDRGRLVDKIVHSGLLSTREEQILRLMESAAAGRLGGVNISPPLPEPELSSDEAPEAARNPGARAQPSSSMT